MKISIVIPAFNEESSLPFLKGRLTTTLAGLPMEREIIVVNDGSTDRTGEIVKDWIEQDASVILIELSRNFGHQQAITAGLHESTGDCVVILDADLQDPPEEIHAMVQKWNEGCKVVFAERTGRMEPIHRRLLFAAFYKFFLLLSDLPVIIQSGVFSLMDRAVVNHLLNMKERNRFIPGMQGWLGFKTATIYYQRQDRLTGRPKQSLKRLTAYALDAVFSFSYKPLRLSFLAGIMTTAFFFAYGTVLVVMRLLNINVVRGFTTPTVAIFFIGGLMLISNGITGEYVARIYDEVKNRPLFILSRKVYRNREGKLIEQEPPAL
ncbi:MAG TPA: glycosyltransferase family 2 protein [Candidatus Omnitrophota bacterium]|nr:glycosyltransferase family 2 protein [Candidatus Omnitrophota bacterium]